MKKKKSRNQKLHAKEEECDFGPWNRANTNEFENML